MTSARIAKEPTRGLGAGLDKHPIQKPAVSLGGTSTPFFACEELLHGMLAPLLKFFLWCEISTEVRDQFGTHPGWRNSHNAQRPEHQALSNSNRFTWTHVTRGFRGQFIHRHASRTARVTRQTATFKIADGPKPLVLASGGINSKGAQ